MAKRIISAALVMLMLAGMLAVAGCQPKQTKASEGTVATRQEKKITDAIAESRQGAEALPEKPIKSEILAEGEPGDICIVVDAGKAEEPEGGWFACGAPHDDLTESIISLEYATAFYQEGFYGPETEYKESPDGSLSQDPYARLIAVWASNSPQHSIGCERVPRITGLCRMENGKIKLIAEPEHESNRLAAFQFKEDGDQGFIGDLYYQFSIVQGGYQEWHYKKASMPVSENEMASMIPSMEIKEGSDVPTPGSFYWINDRIYMLRDASKDGAKTVLAFDALRENPNATQDRIAEIKTEQDRRDAFPLVPSIDWMPILDPECGAGLRVEPSWNAPGPEMGSLGFTMSVETIRCGDKSHGCSPGMRFSNDGHAATELAPYRE